MSVPTATIDSLYRPNMLIFFGSPRENGYTAKLVDMFLDVYPFSCQNIFRINAYQRQVKPCIGCGDCKYLHFCRFDDMDDIDRMLKESKLLLFATPVYCNGFPAPMKAILDRFQRYYCSPSSLSSRSKRAILLTASGSCDNTGAFAIEKALSRQFTVMNTKLVGHFYLLDTDNRSEITQEEREKLISLANKLI